MGVVTIEGKKIIYERRNEYACLEAYGPDVLRWRSSPNGSLSEERWNLLKPEETETVVVEKGDGCATITNGIISATVYESGKVIYFKRGQVLLEEMTEYAFNGGYRTYRPVGNDTHKAEIYFKPEKEEHFYGLGGEHNDCFDMKGSTSQLLHRNTKASIPFVYSSRGYGFLWNSPSIGQCELTNNHSKWIANRTKQVDYLVIAGDTPKEILFKYSKLSGFAPAFPKFAAGFWQCKLRYESQEDLLQVAREYKKRNIPISVIVIDYFHWTEQGDFKFEPTLWPDPEAMVKELAEMGIQLVVSVWPTINPRSENYRYMDDRNMLLRTENGLYGMIDFYGQQDYIDTLNEKTRDYAWSRIKKNYYDKGVKHFWLDESEPGMVPNHYDAIRSCRGNFEEVALLYPAEYARMFYEGLKASGETEIILLERTGYIGSQRYAALIWSGDIPSTFEALRKSVKTGLNMSMSGIPWWTTDIGGFWGGDIESDYFRELVVRWFQFGVFCPVTRLHGSRNRQSDYVYRHPGVKEASGGDNEIWSFGERNYSILKELIELRERLRPYVMKYMEEASKTGVSIMRPLFVNYPEDLETYTLEDEYMFGDDIVFAPITEQGITSRRVYLPEGEWIRVGNRRKVGEASVFLRGYHNAAAELDEFIAYVRKGSDAADMMQ